MKRINTYLTLSMAALLVFALAACNRDRTETSQAERAGEPMAQTMPGGSTALRKGIIAYVLDGSAQDFRYNEALRPGGQVVHVADSVRMELAGIFYNLSHTGYVCTPGCR